MKIINIKKVEDCFDGSSVFNYWFTDPWQQKSIMNLNSFGEVEYFPDFPRPFFRLRGKNGFQVKGVEGEINCRVIFPRKEKDVIKKNFENSFK